MIKLRIVQAEYGDCFILEYGTPAQPRFALIDGGPKTVFKNHLRPELQNIHDKGGHLDLAALSHVDDDHVKGLLDLMDELCKEKKKGSSLTIAVDALWHNTFSQTIGADVEDGYVAMMADKQVENKSIFLKEPSERSLLQGDKLTRDAGFLDIPINQGFKQYQPINVENALTPVVFGNLSLQVVGPTQKNLDNLRQEWLDWLKKQGTRDLLAPTDQSVPNLSSLMFLAEADGKTILFTGDGRSDDLLEGLRQANLLDPQGNLHVDVFKVPHHGSARNVSKDFFNKITADRYIISANGRDDNPDLDTLKWIVEAARDQARSIEIVITNSTQSTKDIEAECPPQEYGYTLVKLNPDQDSMVVELA